MYFCVCGTSCRSNNYVQSLNCRMFIVCECEDVRGPNEVFVSMVGVWNFDRHGIIFPVLPVLGKVLSGVLPEVLFSPECFRAFPWQDVVFEWIQTIQNICSGCVYCIHHKRRQNVDLRWGLLCVGSLLSCLIMSAAFSPIIIVGALVLPAEETKFRGNST